MEGTRDEPAAIARTDAVVRPRQTWLIESQPGDAGLTVETEPEHVRWLLGRVESAYITVAILVSMAFLYASTVPWIFAIPDLESRFAGVLESCRWNPEQPLDPAANVLAFIPIGFVWSAAWGTSSSNRRSRRTATIQVAIGCLALAVLAEGLQFWIPLRDPSIRDVLALECGAILGCGLWLAVGHRVTVMLCSLTDRLLWVGGTGPFRLRLLLLFAAAYLACLLIILCASPVQFFLTYRGWSISLQHIAISRPNIGPPREHGLLAVLSMSGVAALLLVGTCRIGRSAVGSLKRRTPGQ
jgi:hypothetical protein